MSIGAHIILVVPNQTGGGAENIVEYLHSGLLDGGVSCERVHFCGLKLEGPPITRFGLRHDAVANVIRLRRLLQERVGNYSQPIVVHSHLTHGFYASFLASRGLPVRWIHTEHNTTMRLREYAVARFVERNLYNRCNQVVAISNGVRDALLNRLKIDRERVTVIQNGSRLFSVPRRERVGDDIFRLVSVGSLNQRKGFATILRAVSAASIGKWHYTIVGDGPDKAMLQNLAAELGVGDQVTFAGWQRPEAYFYEAHLQLVPSQWEGFGLVAAEGMSTGLHVLASNVEGLKEVVGECPAVGGLVDGHLESRNWVGPIEKLAHRIRQMSCPNSLEAVARAQYFTIQKMVDCHIDLYASLFGSCR